MWNVGSVLPRPNVFDKVPLFTCETLKLQLSSFTCLVPEFNNWGPWLAHSLVDEKPFLRIESNSCITREVMLSGTVRFVLA